MNIKRIVTYSIISTIYVVLSLIMGSLSFAGMQIRLSELLMVFCVFDKKYILPVTLGCFLTNLIGLIMGVNVVVIDILFGTIATLISGVLMYVLRNIKYRDRPLLSLLMPCIINGLIIGFELAIYLGNGANFLILFITNAIWVFIGEIISVFILGNILYIPISKLIAYLQKM